MNGAEENAQGEPVGSVAYAAVIENRAKEVGVAVLELSKLSLHISQVILGGIAKQFTCMQHIRGRCMHTCMHACYRMQAGSACFVHSGVHACNRQSTCNLHLLAWTCLSTS
jgi:hypothetical protein